MILYNSEVMIFTITYFSAILGIILLFSGGFVAESFAVDYRDSSGYTPSWAKGQGYHSVLNQCNNLIGDYSSDGNWCYEWVAYVLDQGVDNFPQSTSGGTSPIPNFKLEDGPLYSGDLTKFLPKLFTYGDDWLVGKPFTVNELEKMSVAGITDFFSQRIVVPDEWDKTNFLKISYVITEFDKSKTALEFYSNLKSEIYSQNFPTVSEYFELKAKGIYVDKIELEKSSQYFVTDCIGQIINFYKENESAKLTCVKDNYLVMVMVTWKTGIYNTSFISGSPESAVYDYAEIMVNNIDNDLHPNPNVSFPSGAQYVAFQYSKEKINDNELLSYFQKSIDEGKIKFPTSSIVIEKNSKRSSYVPDFNRISIMLWGEGTLTDAHFANTMIDLVENGYLTIPGFDSSSITVSSGERDPFFDSSMMNDPKETTQPTQSQTVEKSTTSSNPITQEKEIKSSEKSAVETGMNVTANAFAALLLIGMPILFVVLIVLKSKKRLPEGMFKKIMKIMGIIFLALFVIGIVFGALI